MFLLKRLFFMCQQTFPPKVCFAQLKLLRDSGNNSFEPENRRFPAELFFQQNVYIYTYIICIFDVYIYILYIFNPGNRRNHPAYWYFKRKLRSIAVQKIWRCPRSNESSTRCCTAEFSPGAALEFQETPRRLKAMIMAI